MDFLGNILSGQDLVNKDYVDKAIPVVPTKLSELTDDILSGKYLPLSGGTVTGTIEFTASTPALKFYRDYGNVPYIHFGASPTSGYGEVGADKNGNLVFWSLVSGNSAYNAWNTVLHAKNIGEYALPLSGGTIEGNGAGLLTINRKDGNPVIEFRHNGSVMGRYGFATDGTPIGVVAGSQVTLIHSGNVGNYNAGSATKLQTARTIWGQSFDGTGNVSGSLILPYGSTIQLGSPDGNTCQVFAYDANNNVNICSISAKVGHGTNIYGNNVKVHYGTNRKVGLILNSSGNVTIGSSDTAGADYKLRVDGESRFTDRVSVTSLRIVPVNGSYAADFAIDGSSLTLNRELKFTNVTASDICSGIAAAFKTSLAQAESLIARNIILGASSGSASNLALNFQKYTSISNTAPNGLTTLMTLTTDGSLGIGTTNPAYKLDVAGSIGCTGGFAAPYFHKSDEFYIGSGALGVSASGALIYTYNNLPIYFYTSGTAAMTIDSGHRVTMEAGLHVKGNFHAGSTWSEDGTSGTAGVTLRNEGGIEISHASTPYIDFHHANSTTDFSMRLITRSNKILSFSCSGGAFCPYNGNESLGASSYRWNILWVSGINVSGNTDVGGALTVGAGATFNGDVRINGNLVVTGDTASGGAGQETTSTSQLLVINQIIPEGTSVTQSALDAIGLTSNVIDDLLEGKYHHVLEVIGSNKSLYTISGFKSTTTREFILQYGSAEVDTAWWYAFRQYNGGNWSVTFDEI